MTEAERRLVDAAVHWWHSNRDVDTPSGSELLDYYNQPDVRALVCAAADVASERGEA